MLDDELTPGERAVLEAHKARRGPHYSFLGQELIGVIAGYRAAVSIITDRINFLTAEIEREPTSNLDVHAQIQYRVERTTLQEILSRLIDG